VASKIVRWIASFNDQSTANDWVLNRGGKMLRSWGKLNTHCFRVMWDPKDKEWNVWLCEKRKP
jgi:hypothetical protein